METPQIETPIRRDAYIDHELLHGTFHNAVDAERLYQQRKWGDDHDAAHSPAEWAMIVLMRAGDLGDVLERWLCDPSDVAAMQAARRETVKVAAVCRAIADHIDAALWNADPASPDDPVDPVENVAY